ncbi:Putative phosphotransferase [Gluconacetobacter sp. SXCC-1]|nr:Putative phosphotransferase [Gluconacetobacter sp. SXCC-1]
MMLPGRSMATPGMSETSVKPYIDPQNVQEELQWARRLCVRYKWPVINVTHRSVEETAAAIIDMLEHDGVGGRPAGC